MTAPETLGYCKLCGNDTITEENIKRHFGEYHRVDTFICPMSVLYELIQD